MIIRDEIMNQFAIEEILDTRSWEAAVSFQYQEFNKQGGGCKSPFIGAYLLFKCFFLLVE